MVSNPGDPDSHDIPARFQSLKTKAARRSVYESPYQRGKLHHLLDQLRPDEWRDLRNRMNSRTFQCDILGSLPLEIAVQIAQYLDLSEIHVLQRVSRNWQMLLSSDLVRNAVYRRFSGRTLNFADEESNRTFIQYAKKRTKLERGQPSSKNHGPLPTTQAPNIDYSNGQFACTTWTGDRAIVWSVRTGSSLELETENRDLMSNIRLSDSILAAITPRGYCHVWNLQTKESAYFRLPSTSFRLFVVRGTEVALGFPGSAADGSVMIWDFDSRVARTIDVPPGLIFMNLNPTVDSLTTVHLESKNDSSNPLDAVGIPGDLAQLRIVKHWLSDPSRASHTFKALDLPVNKGSDWLINPDLRLSENFNHRIGILRARPLNTHTSAVEYIIAITQDTETNHTYLHILPPEQASSPHLCLVSIDYDLFYYLKVDQGKRAIWISNPNALVPHYPAKAMDIEFYHNDHSIDVFDGTFALMGDHEKVFLFDLSGVSVWSFNESD